MSETASGWAESSRNVLETCSKEFIITPLQYISDLFCMHNLGNRNTVKPVLTQH